MDNGIGSRSGDRRAELQRMRQATEDDLLAQQQAFLAQPKQPAAKVVRATRSSPPTAQPSPPTLSAFKREQLARHAAQPSNLSSTTARPAPTVLSTSALSAFDDDDDDEYDDDDTDEPAGYSAPRMVAPAVLSGIVERDSSSSQSILPPSAQHIPLGSVQRGFPATFRVTSSSAPAPAANQPVKKSLFALQREQERRQQQAQASQPLQQQQTNASVGTEPRPAEEQSGQGSESQWRDKAAVAGATDDRQRISAENEQKLAGMSTEEIEQAQRELHKSLPPALVARLMHSASRSVAQSTATPSTIDRLFGQQPTETDETKQPPVVDDRQPPLTMPAAPAPSSPHSIPINPSPVPYPPSAKTEWMAPLPSPAAPPQWQQLSWHTGLSSSANDGANPSSGSEVGTAWQYWRLDFKGRWIDERLQPSNNEDRYDGLYHHGLHAERAGYSLDEMLYLCHSQLPAQRQLMLDLLTRVLTHVHDAVYAIPQPVSETRLQAVDFNALVLERLMVLGVVTVLRVAMDDAAVGIVAAGVRGIEALLYRRQEEERRRQRRLTWRGHWLLPAELSQQALDAWDKPFQPAAVEQVEGNAEAIVEKRRALVEDDVRDNSDDEAVCRRDVVVGLVRMRLLPRLRFLLEVHSTPSDTATSSSAAEVRVFSPLVNSIIHILLLIAQHSASAVHAMATTSHLLPVLSSLTLSLPQSSIANPHLLPLLSLLCTSPTVVQHFASTGALLHCHSYMLVANGLPGSIAPQPSAAAFTLARDALQLWRTSLGTYALDEVVAAEELTTFFPVLMQILVRRHAAAAAALTAEHKEEQKRVVEEKEEGSDGEGWQREEMEQVRAAYNVLKALCGCIGKSEVTDDEEPSAISVTHLASSLDYAVAQFTSSLCSPVPSTRQMQHISCMAGMAHFVASYYEQLPTTAAFSASVSSHQLDRQWQTVWAKWTDSPVLEHVVSRLCSSTAVIHSSYSSSMFCFPSTLLTVPAQSYVDFLLSLCRWLLASVRLVADKREAVCQRLRVSAVLPSLSQVAVALSNWPVVDAHTALLLYHIVMLCHQSASIIHYRAAVVAVCPLLTAGYRSEVDELLRVVLLGELSLSNMREVREHTWTRERGNSFRCAVCDWTSRDALPPSALGETLLPAVRAALGLQTETEQGKRDRTLEQRSVASPATVSLQDSSTTWPLLLSRNLLLLTSLPPTASASQVQQTAVLRSYIQYLALLIDGHIWSSNDDRSTAARALMELLVRSPDCTADPQLSLPLTHCVHSLLPGLSFNTAWLNRPRSGWGSNFFTFATELVELYVSEAVDEEVWGELLLLLLQRGLVRDYRLMVYSRCMEVDVQVRSGWPGWQHVLWAREDSAEVLAVYREYVSKRRGGEGVLCETAMHHLLCDWFGEEAVLERREVVGKEEKIRQRMGRADDGVIHALLSYRYMRD